MKTTKNDWLNDHLAETGKIVVSGHKSATNLLGLPASARATFRFAGNRTGPTLSFLTIEVGTSLWENIFQLLSNSSSQLAIVIREVKNHLSLEMPCILYSEENVGEFGYFNGSSSTVNSAELQDEIGKIYSDLTRNTGDVSKRINKSLNDAFQVWGRSHLSKYYVVNDFDAFTLPSSGLKVMYELKRIQEDIFTWRPYLDDNANYAALIILCKIANIRLRVIAYQDARKDLVAVHHIISSTASKIAGEMLICPPKHITDMPIGEKYTSLRTRDTAV